MAEEEQRTPRSHATQNEGPKDRREPARDASFTADRSTLPVDVSPNSDGAKSGIQEAVQALVMNIRGVVQAPVMKLRGSTDRHGPQRRLLRGVDSLAKLIDANKSDDATFNKIVAEFEKRNGLIENAYFTRGTNSCAVVVTTRRPKRRDGDSEGATRGGDSAGATPEEDANPDGKGRSGIDWVRRKDKRRIVMVRLDRRDLALQVPLFDDAVWRTILMARQTEYRATRLLSYDASGVVANVLYTVAVFLLSALDNISERGKKKGLKPAEETLLANAAKVAMSHLDKLEEFVKRTGVTTAIRYYLIGLPIGLAVIGMVGWFIYMQFGLTGSSKLFVTTIAAGAIGSVASVMFRITRGQTLSVNTDQGRLVTIINGGFRPLVGAVFGVALYILVQGQLLPLADPGETGGVGGFGGVGGVGEVDSVTRIQQFSLCRVGFLVRVQ